MKKSINVVSIVVLVVTALATSACALDYQFGDAIFGREGGLPKHLKGVILDQIEMPHLTLDMPHFGLGHEIALTPIELIKPELATPHIALPVTLTTSFQATDNASVIGGKVKAGILKTDGGTTVNVGVGATKFFSDNAQVDHAIDAGVEFATPVGPASISGSATVTNSFMDDVHVPGFEIGGKVKAGILKTDGGTTVNVGVGATKFFSDNAPLDHTIDAGVEFATPLGHPESATSAISGSAKITNLFKDDVHVPVFEVGGGFVKQVKPFELAGSVSHEIADMPVVGITRDTTVALSVSTPKTDAKPSFNLGTEKNITNGDSSIAAEVTFPLP